MRAFLRRHVFNNAAIKIFSLVLAIILYLHVFARQEREVVLEMPLELQDVPAELTWSGALPDAASVRLRGVGMDLFKLRTRTGEMRVRVDVSEARPGLYQRPLVADDVRIPRDANVEVLGVESPQQVSLVFDRLMTVRLPVAPTVEGREAPGYIGVGGVVVEPDSAAVRGPEGRVRSFEFVRTEPVDISQAEATVTRRVPLVPPPGCSVMPPDVQIRVGLERVVSRTFSDLEVEVLLPAGIGEAQLTPPTGSVDVSGPQSAVNSLTPEDLRLSVDARDLPSGTYTVMASVELRRSLSSAGIRVEPVKPERFELELE
ncbi:MAG: hypothetical protein GF330_09535 [Candidatus Eisenbacteria bacterium]|nr:hypothetical protein [Candidatus Eisenbacteria bacterium]